MSIAILSIPLGIISIIVFIWAMNGTGAKPSKGKKKDNDSAIIGIIVSVLLFFVSIGIFDIEESTAGLLGSENSTREQAAQHQSKRYSEKTEAQREVEEYNKAAVEKARHGNENNQSDSKAENADRDDSKVKDNKSDKDLEKQRQAYQQWYNQVEAKVQSIDTIRAALWNDNSPDSVEKLMKVIDKEKAELAEIKVPKELSTAHQQRLNEAMERYMQWLDSHHQACQMRVDGKNQQDILNEVAKGDGFKLRSNVEISNVGRELGK